MQNSVELARKKFAARIEEQREACSDARMTFFPMESAVSCMRAAKGVDSAAYDYARALYSTGEKGVVSEAFARSMHLCSASQMDRAAFMSRNLLLPAMFQCTIAQSQVTRFARRELERQVHADSNKGLCS